jgi:hypothetical protein
MWFREVTAAIEEGVSVPIHWTVSIRTLFRSGSLPLEGRAGEGGDCRIRFTQRALNLLHHLPHVFIQRLVAKAKHAKSARSQPGSAASIAISGVVL